MKWHVLTDDPKSYPQKPPDTIDEFGRRRFTTGCQVIVTTARGNVFCCDYQWCCLHNGKGEFWYMRSDNIIKDVIAWMPLPKPYKEGEKEYVKDAYSGSVFRYGTR